MLRNVVATNLKVPLTPIEKAIQLTAGPAHGSAAIRNLRPFALPGTRARLGIATSLPAFQYGTPAPGVNPCSDTAAYYMRCLDRLGANVVIQDEANPGAWTGADGDGIEQWQPLSWMSSTYRSVSDPGVHFAYNVTAMMVGNLADLVFDGQSAITQRGALRGPGMSLHRQPRVSPRRGRSPLPRLRRPAARLSGARALGGARRLANGAAPGRLGPGQRLRFAPGGRLSGDRDRRRPAPAG